MYIDKWQKLVGFEGRVDDHRDVDSLGGVGCIKKSCMFQQQLVAVSAHYYYEYDNYV